MEKNKLKEIEKWEEKLVKILKNPINCLSFFTRRKENYNERDIVMFLEGDARLVLIPFWKNHQRPWCFRIFGFLSIANLLLCNYTMVYYLFFLDGTTLFDRILLASYCVLSW